MTNEERNLIKHIQINTLWLVNELAIRALDARKYQEFSKNCIKELQKEYEKLLFTKHE